MRVRAYLKANGWVRYKPRAQGGRSAAESGATSSIDILISEMVTGAGEAHMRYLACAWSHLGLWSHLQVCLAHQETSLPGHGVPGSQPDPRNARQFPDCRCRSGQKGA